jgi:hypothetical protein
MKGGEYKMAKKKEGKKQAEEAKVVKSLSKCQTFSDLQTFLKSQSEDKVTSVLDKTLLQPHSYDELVKKMEKENERIGSKDFKNPSRIKAHIKFRENQGWKFETKEDKVQLVGLEK